VRGRLLALAATICAGITLVELASSEQGRTQGTSVARTAAPAAAPATVPAASPGASAAGSSLVSEGRALFGSSCASCHGIDATGIPGRAPSLRGVGALAADFYLKTGRMPLPSPRAQPLRTSPAFPQRQITALDAYVGSFGGPAIPAVNPQAGSLSEGQRLFGLDCAGCHTIQGQGGIVTGAIVPSLGPVTPTQIAQAIRIGPYVMPRFGSAELSDAQINSIARYVQSIRHPSNRGGWGLGRIGPIPEGMVAWLLAAAALLLIARLLGERTPDESQHPPAGGAST
jgi:quinol---cytochrome-c reductase cytochrome c subunit